MKNIIKPHFLMFFTFLKPVLILAFVPSIRTLLAIIFLKTFGGFLYIEAALFILLSIIAEFRRKSLSLSLFDDFIIIKKGLYFKTEYKIKKEKIVLVYIGQNIIERLFSAKTVYINTVSDKKSQNTVKITVKAYDAQKIVEFIKLENKLKRKRFSLLRIMAFAVVSSGGVEGILFLVPIIRRFLKFLGIELYGDILAEFIGKTKMGDQYMPRVINAITLIVVFVFLLGFLYQFFKNVNQTVIRYPKLLFIKSGIITKHENLIRTEEIKGIIAEQTLFLRVFRCYTLNAVLGGYKSRFSINGVIAPILTEKELQNDIKNFFNDDFLNKPPISKQKAPFGMVSVVLLPLSLFMMVFAVSLFLFLKFSNYRRFITLIFILANIILFFYAEILIYGYKKGKITFSRNILFIGTKHFKTQSLYISPKNVVEIKIKENPFDRKRGSCKVLLFVFSKSNNSVSLRWLKKKEVMENLINKV